MSTIAAFSIKNRRIGPREPCYIIAEAGVNHDGNVETAKRLVDAAKAAGADAVKFQTGDPRNVMSDATPKAGYQRESTGNDGTMLEMVQRIAMDFDQFTEIKNYCDQVEILFLSTPFDLESVDFLVSLGMPAIKVPSGEINNVFLLRKVAEKGLPILLSTGMSWMSEIATAIEILRSGGCEELALFQCVSNYPAEPDSMNLRAIASLADAFGVPCGFSDHSLGIDLAVASVAAGAALIEKHFTLDRTMVGPDHAMSLEPTELKALVDSVRRVERAMGDGVKRPQSEEFEVRAVARRSLAAARNIKAGTIAAFSDFFALRPASGLPPQAVEQMIGRKATHDIAARTLISPDDFV